MKKQIDFQEYRDSYKKVAYCLWRTALSFNGDGQYAVVSNEFGREVRLFHKRTEAERYAAEMKAGPIRAGTVYDLEPLLRNRCESVTLKGKQCKRFSSHAKTKCWQHWPQDWKKHFSALSGRKEDHALRNGMNRPAA